MSKNVVVVIDGDIASATLITQLLKEGYTVQAMSFKTETTNLKKIEMINKLVTELEVEHHMIDAEQMSYMFENNLTEFLYQLSFQVALANQLKADIYFPSYRDDKYGNFPATISKSIFLGSDRKVRLNVPYLRMSLDQVISIGVKNNTKYDLTWSCENSENEPCGLCDSCLERQAAFNNQNTRDIGSPNPEVAINVNSYDNRSKTETAPKDVSDIRDIPEVQLPNKMEATRTTLNEAASDAITSDQRDPHVEVPPEQVTPAVQIPAEPEPKTVDLPSVPDGTPEELEPTSPKISNP